MFKQMLFLFVVLLLNACTEQAPATSDKEINNQQEESKVILKPDPARYTKGLGLYQETCAACHGQQGEGAMNWQKRDEKGQSKPPPLNGSGHTWHHPKRVLVDVIRNGTMRLGGNMPPWKDKLSDNQIEDILYWLQSQWPIEIYQAWLRNNIETKTEK